MSDFPTIAQISVLERTHHEEIPEEYLDSMGHMNVMWYTYLYGRAMQELFKQVGIDVDYVRQHKAGTFALERHVRYLAEVHFGQRVSIYPRVVGCSAKRFHVVKFMVNDSTEQLASVMETVGTHADLTARRSSPMPDWMAARFSELLANHQSLAWQPPLCGVMSA